MTASDCMVFFSSAERAFDLDETARLLADRGLDVTRAADTLFIGMEDGPALRVSLSSEPHVVTEATEIAEATPFAVSMSRCDRRFEIGFDDLDEVLDEMNTLIEVQATLQGATRGYLFSSWNDELSGPEQTG